VRLFWTWKSRHRIGRQYAAAAARVDTFLERFDHERPHQALGMKVPGDLGNFDDETCRLDPIANPFGPKVLPMSQE
jgi:hypothetical protein